SLDTSAALLIFSILSSSENPRLLLMPTLRLSPSNSCVTYPACSRFCSKERANVLFPDPDKPTIQITNALCFNCCSLSLLDRILSKIGYIFSTINIFFAKIEDFLKNYDYLCDKYNF